MNIIIPLGGKGERFCKEGYSMPKPLIKIMNKEMIFWVLDNLNIIFAQLLQKNIQRLYVFQ